MIGIKNFVMPANCEDCPLCYDMIGCSFYGVEWPEEHKWNGMRHSRAEQCPLFEIECEKQPCNHTEALRCNPGEIITAILTSLSYNRDEQDMCDLVTEVHARLENRVVEWSDDGNIIYGALICLYGDYGTSPRSGWFDDHDMRKALLDTFDDCAKSYMKGGI